MKRIFLLLSLFPLLCFAQKMPRNYGVVDSIQHSLAFKELYDKYDHVLAYTTEGFWESNVIHYALIAEKQGAYFKGSIVSEKKGDKLWSAPVVKLNPVDAKKSQSNSG